MCSIIKKDDVYIDLSRGQAFIINNILLNPFAYQVEYEDGMTAQYSHTALNEALRLEVITKAYDKFQNW